MSYAQLNSPLPGLTVSPDGDRCCGMRGHHAHHHLGMLGDDLIDTTSTDNFGTLTDPTGIDAPIQIDPIFSTDSGNLPLAPTISPSEASYPSSVGTEFVLQGPNQYVNIQTGQVVPLSVAQQVTAATAGSATANLDTTATGNNVTLTDPNTGITSTVATNNLTAAAQALQSAGQLVTAAGKLTAQGQALLNAGNLYNAPPASTAGFSAAISSLTSWFSGSTLITGVPNMVVLGGLLVAVMVIPSLVPSGPKRRKR
jgi:hypothetical protein